MENVYPKVTAMSNGERIGGTGVSGGLAISRASQWRLTTIGSAVIMPLKPRASRSRMGLGLRESTAAVLAAEFLPYFNKLWRICNSDS